MIVFIRVSSVFHPWLKTELLFELI